MDYYLNCCVIIFDNILTSTDGRKFVGTERVLGF